MSDRVSRVLAFARGHCPRVLRRIPGWFLLASLLVAVAMAPVTAQTATGAEPEDVAASLRTAQRLGLRVGDVIDVGADPAMSRSFRARIAVIYSSPEHPAEVARGDLQLRFHLPALETLLGRRDTVDRVVVRLRDRADPAAAVGVHDDLRALAAGFDVYTDADLIEHTSQTFVVIARFHRAIGLITILASGIFLITIMGLRLTEMRREIGALRLAGVSHGTIGLTVMLVAAAVAVAGCMAGIGLGAAMVWAINAYYQPLFGTTLRFAVLEPGTLAFAGGLAMLLSLAAGAVAAVRVLRRPPLEQVGR